MSFTGWFCLVSLTFTLGFISGAVLTSARRVPKPHICKCRAVVPK